MAIMTIGEAAGLAARTGFRDARKPRRVASRSRAGSAEAGTFENQFWGRHAKGDTNRIVQHAQVARAEARRRRQEAKETGIVPSDQERAMAQLTNNALAVLRALADYARNCRGRVYPSYDTIASIAGVAKRTIARVLNALESAGLVVRRRRYVRIAAKGPGPRVRQTSNAYRIAMPKWIAPLIPRWLIPAPKSADQQQHEADAATELQEMTRSETCEQTAVAHGPTDPEMTRLLLKIARGIDRDSASAKTAQDSPIGLI